jgi:hypothetical protein
MGREGLEAKRCGVHEVVAPGKHSVKASALGVSAAPESVRSPRNARFRVHSRDQRNSRNHTVAAFTETTGRGRPALA